MTLHLHEPAWLLLALLIPPLIWWWYRRPRRAVRHSLAQQLHGLPVGRARWTRRIGALLRALALLALVLGLARPRWPDLRTPIRTEGIALMMVVDTSGSMEERDFSWEGIPITRLEAVKRAFRLFILGNRDGPPSDGAAPHFEGRPTDLVGLVTFASRPEPLCPLTLSHGALMQVLTAEQARTVPGESETNISDAVVMGLYKLLAAGPRRKVLVVLTDGEHNRTHPSSKWTPLQAAQIAAGLKIPLYTIDAGPELSLDSQRDRQAPRDETGIQPSPAALRIQAEQTLRDLAEMTGGRYFSARDTAALVDACRTIDALERKEIQSFQYRRYHEAYPWLGLASLLSMTLALTLERTLWRRLP
jgi:Ca-activated chloride channel family protein